MFIHYLYYFKFLLGGLIAIDVSNDGTLIATAGNDFNVHIWKTSYDI